MFCPSCKYEYRADIKKCPDCDIALVDELPKEPEPQEVELVEVASFTYEGQAQAALLNLDSHGIKAYMGNEKIAQTDMILAWADGGMHILVRGEDATRARKILEEG